MLIITRRPGEKIMPGDDVVVEVMEVSGSSVRIGIAAPILVTAGRGHQVINQAPDAPVRAPLFAAQAGPSAFAA